MNKILSLGVDPTHTLSEQQADRNNNYIAVICAITGIVYIPFLLMTYPELIIYPSLLVVISVAILAVNFMGAHVITRPVNAVQMITLATLFHASIITQGQDLLVPFFCTQLAMTIIPWVLYSGKKTAWLLLLLGLNYGLLAAQQWLNSLLEVAVDVTYFRESYLTPMTYVWAAVIQLACLARLRQLAEKGPVSIPDDKAVGDLAHA